MFARLETYFDSLTHHGLERGYYPKSFKSVLILCPYNLEAGKEFGAPHGFKVCKSARYLGGYITDYESKQDWPRERTLMWEKNIKMIRETAGKYPQKSYDTVLRAIQ